MTTPREPDEASTSASSMVFRIIVNAFRKNKSKMKHLTEAELIATLERTLPHVDQPVQDIDFDPASLDLDLDLDLNFDFKAESYAKPSVASDVRRAAAPSTTISPRSKSITIRMPGVVLAAIKAKALEMGIPYQTLINRCLRMAVVD